MRNYQLTIADGAKKIFPALAHLGGASRQGDQISFTNYYMEMNKKPFFAICGEFHFSRYSHDRWEDELIKMKMGGINIISTYVFWNHHEEIEGSFDWKENKNIRKFIQLCSKHGLYVILRIGPFAHGEVRNGGMPDWLYGRPFNIRSNDKDYLEYVNRFYQQIAQEISDLLFADNGPIIATQLENEFQHAGSPWELTTGTTNEWLPSGQGGEAHIKILKKMAVKAGIQTPIYTATAWGGGAVAPTDEVLPYGAVMPTGHGYFMEMLQNILPLRALLFVIITIIIDPQPLILSLYINQRTFPFHVQKWGEA
ncbi:beta-galactosidase [Gracilibacillus boraciitolerans JCM 21714]|uniref:Beta-galactosidase n=1 Tax=Gracilibacillus boraciitolerans JCM 21714 TaxID=1298598 RepID=W4VHA3_9BACI|nr:beta-galactosidase [Gracilibacillus boraciitolerans JCM 21714]